jgi:hypothetical protein
MTRDSKLGLVLGVGLVLTIAITFFRKDQATATPSASTTSVHSVQPSSPAEAPTPSPPPHMPQLGEPPAVPN